jgi:hypothetical protein
MITRITWTNRRQIEIRSRRDCARSLLVGQPHLSRRSGTKADRLSRWQAERLPYNLSELSSSEGCRINSRPN